MPVVLKARAVSSGYGPRAVVHDIDLEVSSGEVVVLLGANGAGKTTTMLTLAGVLPMLQGTVELEGVVTRSALHRRARNGMALVTEERSVFKGLSCRDNLRAGDDDVLTMFPELEKRLAVSAGLGSGGEQQMLTLGRALARRPRLLLAGELSLGLAPLIVGRLLEAVRASADDDGTAVLLVEQHARKALKYADRVYVMRRGRLEMALSASKARARISEVEAAYISVDGGARSPD